MGQGSTFACGTRSDVEREIERRNCLEYVFRGKQAIIPICSLNVQSVENLRRTYIVSQKVHFRTYERTFGYASAHICPPLHTQWFLHLNTYAHVYPRSTPLYANNFRTFSFIAICLSIFNLPGTSLSLCISLEAPMGRFNYEYRYENTLAFVYAIIRARLLFFVA